jgi:hypothetical protein
MRKEKNRPATAHDVETRRICLRFHAHILPFFGYPHHV